MRITTRLEILYYDIKWGIKNLIYYFPVIWNTRPWDSVYNLEILQRSLVRLRKCIETGSEIRESRFKKVKDIRTCELLIERIVKDEYYLKDIPKDKNGDYLKTGLELYKKYTNQDTELLGKILGRKIRTWWD